MNAGRAGAAAQDVAQAAEGGRRRKRLLCALRAWQVRGAVAGAVRQDRLARGDAGGGQESLPPAAALRDDAPWLGGAAAAATHVASSG